MHSTSYQIQTSKKKKKKKDEYPFSAQIQEKGVRCANGYSLFKFSAIDMGKHETLLTKCKR